LHFICKINKNILGEYKNKIITRDVILTQERLDNHILIYHKKDYEQLAPHLKDIIKNPILFWKITGTKTQLYF